MRGLEGKRKKRGASAKKRFSRAPSAREKGEGGRISRLKKRGGEGALKIRPSVERGKTMRNRMPTPARKKKGKKEYPVLIRRGKRDLRAQKKQPRKKKGVPYAIEDRRVPGKISGS